MPAKQRDPAFLYYDADVALDVSHMNRIEKGCYLDLIQVYKRYHGFTMVQIRYLLGNDFDSCWNAISLVLLLEEERYHIPWLRNSLEQKAIRNAKQKENINKRWNKAKNGNTNAIPPYNRGNTIDIPTSPFGTTNVIPIIETETETKERLEKEEGGAGEEERGREENFGHPHGPPWPEFATELPQRMVGIFLKTFPDYPRQDAVDFAACLQLAYQIADLNGWEWQSALNGKMDAVLAKWGEIVAWIRSSDWYRTKALSFLDKNFQGLIQAKNNGKASKTDIGNFKQAAGNGHNPTLIADTGFGNL